MVIHLAYRQANQLRLSSLKVILPICESSNLRGADGRVVARMGEKNSPVVVDIRMKVEFLRDCGYGNEIGGFRVLAVVLEGR
jgi:hypothetical protein